MGAQLPARAATVADRSADVRRQILPRLFGARPLTVSCSALLGGMRAQAFQLRDDGRVIAHVPEEHLGVALEPKLHLRTTLDCARFVGVEDATREAQARTKIVELRFGLELRHGIWCWPL